MKRYFLSRKDGQVVSFSDEMPSFDPNIFDLTVKDVDETKIDEVLHSKQVRIKNGDIETIPHEENIEHAIIDDFLDKMKKGTATKEDKDLMLVHLLKNSQTR